MTEIANKIHKNEDGKIHIRGKLSEKKSFLNSFLQITKILFSTGKPFHNAGREEASQILSTA